MLEYNPLLFVWSRSAQGGQPASRAATPEAGIASIAARQNSCRANSPDVVWKYKHSSWTFRAGEWTNEDQNAHLAAGGVRAQPRGTASEINESTHREPPVSNSLLTDRIDGAIAMDWVWPLGSPVIDLLLYSPRGWTRACRLRTGTSRRRS